MSKNYYKILELEKNASEADIKKAYLKNTLINKKNLSK